MNKWLLVAPIVLALTGCKKDPAKSNPGKSAEQEASTTREAELEKKSSAPECKLDGTYRFRFSSNGHSGWWFRFSVKGTDASLLEEAEVLGLESGPLELARNDEICELTVGTKSDATGKLSIAIKVDPASNRFAGKLTRTKALSEEDKNVEITGVRDDGAPRSKAECVVAGYYKLEFDERVAWKNEQEIDDRPCDDAPDFASPMVLRVEPFGETLVITARETDPPYKETFAEDSISQDGDCNVTVKLTDENTTLEANIAFAKTKLSGTATRATYQIVEDGEMGENIWTCIGTKVPISAVKVQ